MPGSTRDSKRQAPIGASAIQQTFELFFDQERKQRLRHFSSACFFLGAAALWLFGLQRVENPDGTVPWYITIACTTSLFLLASSKEKSLDFLPGLPKAKAPIALRESLSICFLTVAVTFYIWIGISLLQNTKPLTQKRLQVVDIQLISEKDFQNHHSILPGSQVKDRLRRRAADIKEEQGSLLAQERQAESSSSRIHVRSQARSSGADQSPRQIQTSGKSQLSETLQNQNDLETAKNKKPESANTSRLANAAVPSTQTQAAIPIMVPKSWQTKSIDANSFPPRSMAKSSQSQRSERASQPLISEVQASEMVRLMENDGEADALHIFAQGGMSSGGKGAQNNLSKYLRELHKRIKSAWSPPPGISRKVEMLFRLSREGKLLSYRIQTSSEDRDTDSSAIGAVQSALKNNPPLPGEYPHQYLDLLYTFTYNVDQLQETESNTEDSGL